jgi:hypothetical protein
MYLAKHRIKGKFHYKIRESYESRGAMHSRDLFDLGTDPSQYIVYPGGNAYYFAETIEDTLCELGAEPEPEALDDIFWPFLDPEIKRVVEPFRRRNRKRNRLQKLDPVQVLDIQNRVHLFDKRRMHYLRLGQMDQGYIGRMPAKLLTGLVGISRDEIEQKFMVMEKALEPAEYKNYVYVIFDLQRFFKEMIAKKLPQGLDQKEVDRLFLEEICRLNQNRVFWDGQISHGCLHEYLVRYVIMFFDNDFGHSTFLDDYVKDFMNRHRFYRPSQPESTVSLEEAGSIFGLEKEGLRKMSNRGLSRLYRRLARKYHPDTGGEHKMFVKLTEAYQKLLKRGRQKP